MLKPLAISSLLADMKKANQDPFDYMDVVDGSKVIFQNVNCVITKKMKYLSILKKVSNGRNIVWTRGINFSQFYDAVIEKYGCVDD